MTPTLDDSTHSASSTFAVDDVLIKQPISQIAKAQFPPRKVRFNECRNQCFANAERAAEDCQDTWFTGEDYKQFRSNVRHVFFNDESDDAKYSFSNTLIEIYEVVRAVDFIIEDATSLLTPELEQKLTQFFQASDKCLDFLSSSTMLQFQ
jgi:hypothetical protein